MAKGKKSQKQANANTVKNGEASTAQPTTDTSVSSPSNVPNEVQDNAAVSKPNVEEKGKENVPNVANKTTSDVPTLPSKEQGADNKVEPKSAPNQPSDKTVETKENPPKNEKSGGVMNNAEIKNKGTQNDKPKNENSSKPDKTDTTNKNKQASKDEKTGKDEKVVVDSTKEKVSEEKLQLSIQKEVPSKANEDKSKTETKPALESPKEKPKEIEPATISNPQKIENKSDNKLEIKNSQSEEPKFKEEIQKVAKEDKVKEENKSASKTEAEQKKVEEEQKNKKEDKSEKKNEVKQDKKEEKSVPKVDEKKKLDNEKPNQNEQKNKEAETNVKNNEPEQKNDSKNKKQGKASPPNGKRKTINVGGFEIVEHSDPVLDHKLSDNEKFKIMSEKYSAIQQDFNILLILARKNEKEIALLRNEKDILTLENTKRDLAREKLENLCRELQKQNKAIREENLLKVIQEEEKRKSVSQKLESTLGEISSQVQENNNRTNKLRDENLDITKKFRELLIQYDERETELLEYKTKCLEMSKTESGLRNQITMYSEKYDEFQQTLSRSNEIFAGFKSEMESMSTKINLLEKETATWKQRWEKSHESYLDLSKDKTKSETQLLTTCRQLAALLKLCRTLQSERAEMLAKINGTEPGPKADQENANQETIENTLRQIAASVAENLKSPPVSASVESPPTAKDKKSAAKPSTETKTAPATESSKPNKKGKNKK
ncbi:hypothetical protein WDU94_009206 [Cyamophila willieti]